MTIEIMQQETHL